MERRELGRTGLKVSRLSLGTLIFAKMQADLSVDEGARVVRKCLELGINFIDTAASYGTQQHVREGIRGSEEEVVISTKTLARTVEEAKTHVENSLRELSRERIDIYQLHLVESPEDLEARSGVLEYLLECKRKGIVRFVGASVHTPSAARAVVERRDMDVLFPIINFRGFGIGGSLEDMLEVCRVAKARGIGVMAMKPLGGGNLREHAKEAFGFFRDLDAVDTVCVGMKSAAEVEMNVRLMEGRAVPEEILVRVETIPRRLRINRFCTGCGTCIDACAQRALSVDTSLADPSTGKKGHAVVDQDKCILCGYCAEACPGFCIRVV